MSKPVDAFFIGRALAEAINHQIENTLTNFLSELGKFDAEQKEKLRQFTQEIMDRAQQQAESEIPSSSTNVTSNVESEDLQAVIDELRAEIARLRAELQLYRSQKSV